MAVYNLPHAAASFVNRVSEIADVTSHLNENVCRLLTLVGQGGIGKTRLAMRVRQTATTNSMMVSTSFRFTPSPYRNSLYRPSRMPLIFNSVPEKTQNNNCFSICERRHCCSF